MSIFALIFSAMNQHRKYKIVYCTPALYSAGGVERVITVKANYFAEHFGYEVTKLDRVMFAGLDKYKLPRGEWRFLTDLEVVNLKKI